MDNIEKVMSEKGVFSNFWQADSCKDLFFNVDVCEEVTRIIKRDKNYECCLSENPNSFIGIRANISVSVESGMPYILRAAGGPGKAEYEVSGTSLIVPLFTDEELSILSEIASKVRDNNKCNNNKSDDKFRINKIERIEM